MAPRSLRFLVSLFVLVAAAPACVAPLLTPVPASPAAPSDPGSPPTTATPSWQADMVARINAERAKVALGPLATCGTLTNAAAAHSADQAATSTMSHTGSDGSTMVNRAERAGYTNWTRLAENVAAGYTTVDAVMAGWMASPGHRANLLNGDLTHVGVGRAQSGGGVWYWTQDFGTSGRC